jgi:hypothetical protein
MIPHFFTEDHLELLELLNEHDVEYLLVGGVAVNYYGYSRSTGDIDLLFRRDEDNANRIHAALNEFFGDGLPGLSGPDDLLDPGLILQFGVPPHRIDLLNDISGVDFETVWANRIEETIEGRDISIPIICLDDLIMAKQATGRAKDIDDYEYLRDISDSDAE